jgi:hypothetical protein
MLAIIYLILGLIPPLAAGPLAGLAYVAILKRGKGWYQLPFWALLVAANFLIMFWAISSSGRWLPISSLSAFFLTPVAPIFTVFVMRKAWRRLEVTSGTNTKRERRFITGLVLIPAVQIGMFAILIADAAWLCKIGLILCKNL